MRLAVFALLLPTLAGCTGGASLFYFPPYQVDDLECPEINKRLADANLRASESGALRQRAETSAAGSVVGAIAYGPEHSKAVFDQQNYEAAAARKNCPPPPVAPPSALAPPAPPTPPGAPGKR